jgi:IS30 family transposase
MLVVLASQSDAHELRRFQRQLEHPPTEPCKTLTWDRRLEMAAHNAFAVATDIPVLSFNPQSPRQRGTNGNTNGLLRQYFLKTADLSRTPQRRLNEVARVSNNGPRATLGFHSPEETFDQLSRWSAESTPHLLIVTQGIRRYSVVQESAIHYRIQDENPVCSFR